MSELTDQERKVLTAWEDCDADFDVLNFNDIAHGSQMPHEDAVSATRSLASKGLAAFRRGTFTEDGTPYGSGYGLTDAGRIAMREAETAREDAALRALIPSEPHDAEGRE